MMWLLVGLAWLVIALVVALIVGAVIATYNNEDD